MTRSRTDDAVGFDVEKFSRHARAGALMTALGGIVVILALAYSGKQLSIVETARSEQEERALELQMQVGQLAREKEHLEKDLQHLRDRSIRARNASTPLQSGLKAFFTKNYMGAVAYYDQAIEIDPENPVLFDFKGYALLRAGRVNEAVNALERSVQIAPDYVWGHYNLALAYWRVGRHEDALSEVRRVLELDPSFRETILGDGQFSKFKRSAVFNELVSEQAESSKND